jgi:hypothetical protein
VLPCPVVMILAGRAEAATIAGASLRELAGDWVVATGGTRRLEAETATFPKGGGARASRRSG